MLKGKSSKAAQVRSVTSLYRIWCDKFFSENCGILLPVSSQ